MRRFPRFVLSLGVALTLLASGPSHAAVRLAVSPETLTVIPGATFTLELRVPVAGSVFNGFDAVVEYDHTQLTFLPANPTTLQQGSSMQGACGNTFLLVQSAGDSISISDVLMCANIALSGPAQLFTLKFRASNTPGATYVRLRNVQFYNEGLYVNPAITSDALIKWGVVLDVAPGPRTLEVGLSVRNNPSRGDQWVDASSPSEGEQQLAVFDAAGRTIRHLDSGLRPAGTRAIHWDGRDDEGRLVAPGIYQARLLAAGRSVSASLVRLP